MPTEIEGAVHRRWVYLGRRWNGPKMVRAWAPEDDLASARTPERDDVEKWFDMTASVIGGIYDVQSPAGQPTKVYAKTVTYIGRLEGHDAEIAIWEATDREVKRSQDYQSAERKAKQSSPLARALEPLVELAEQCHTREQARALASVASERVLDAYWKSKGMS
jgi:hypothetical protein